MKPLAFLIALAAVAIPGTQGSAVAGETHYLFRACGDLAGSPSGRAVDYATPEASACCGGAPACARLLATTVLRRPQADPRT